MSNGLREYAEYAKQKLAESDALKMEDPRTEEEISHAANLQLLAEHEGQQGETLEGEEGETDASGVPVEGRASQLCGRHLESRTKFVLMKI